MEIKWNVFALNSLNWAQFFYEINRKYLCGCVLLILIFILQFVRCLYISLIGLCMWIRIWIFVSFTAERRWFCLFSASNLYCDCIFPSIPNYFCNMRWNILRHNQHWLLLSLCRAIVFRFHFGDFYIVYIFSSNKTH